MIVKSYTHNQSTPSSTWTINHGLGVKPTGDVLVPNGSGDLEKFFPVAITHVSDSQLVITFSSPRTGYVRLVGQGVSTSNADTYYAADSVD